MTTNNSGGNYFFDEETRKALQRASEILNKDLEGMMESDSGGNMENRQDCKKVYRAKEIVDTACEQALALLPKPLNKEVQEKGSEE